MSITEKLNNTEKDTLQLVLEEYAQEQTGNTKAVNDLITVVNGLTGKIKEFEEKIEKPKTVNVSADTKPIQDIVRKGIIDISLTVAAQPKSIVKKFQILLFPEQDRKLFYKVVFGRWLILLAIMLFITNVYIWGIHGVTTKSRSSGKNWKTTRSKRHGIISTNTKGTSEKR